MNTLVPFDVEKHLVVKYVGSNPALETGRLYRHPMNIAPWGRDENDQPYPAKWSLWNGEDYIPVPVEDLAAPDPIPFPARGDEDATLTILSSAHHRNGVGGEPFVVALVAYDSKDEGHRRMLVTMFPTLYTTAVVDLDMAHAGDIGFGIGGNSWRGDRFDAALRATLMEREED